MRINTSSAELTIISPVAACHSFDIQGPEFSKVRLQNAYFSFMHTQKQRPGKPEHDLQRGPLSSLRILGGSLALSRNVCWVTLMWRTGFAHESKQKQANKNAFIPLTKATVTTPAKAPTRSSSPVACFALLLFQVCLPHLPAHFFLTWPWTRISESV